LFVTFSLFVFSFFRFFVFFSPSIPPPSEQKSSKDKASDEGEGHRDQRTEGDGSSALVVLPHAARDALALIFSRSAVALVGRRDDARAGSSIGLAGSGRLAEGAVVERGAGRGVL
jgi:hypothetical protein